MDTRYAGQINILLHKGFLEGLDELSKEDRRRIREALSKLQTDPTSSGLRWHPVMNNFISLSPAMGIRIIAQRLGRSLILLHVGRHDPAYDWARRHSLLTNSDSDVWEIVTVRESDNEVPGSTTCDNAYSAALMSRLKSNHIPQHIASAFKDCTNDDDLVARMQLMSPEWQELILRVSIGEAIEPDDIPSMSSSISVISNDATLLAALDLPMSAWKLFLHPRQREIAEDVDGRLVSIIGGPGTGKSIVCIHRAHYLSGVLGRDEVVAVFTFSKGLIANLRDGLQDLRAGSATHQDNVRFFSCSEIASSQGSGRLLFVGRDLVFDHKGRRSIVAAIIVDEFQDCPRTFIEFLGKARDETTCRFITVALDPCQTIFKTDNMVIMKEFLGKSSSIYLTYCYRMSRQLLEHSYSVFGRYAAEYYDSLDLGQGFNLPIAVISGPRVRYVPVSSQDNLAREASSYMRTLKEKYPDTSSLALIHLQYWSPHFHHKKRTDPVAEALENDPDCRDHYQFGFWTKGKEYTAGVLVCPSNFMARDLGKDNLMRLNTLFVTLTRFREELVVIYQADAPIASYLALD